MNKFHKKGQITLFVIIGLVLLLGALFFFFARLSIVQSQENKILNSADKVDNTYRPIQQQVETCLFQLSKDSLDKIGVHGGYLEPFGEGQQTFTYTESKPYESEGIAFTNDKKTFVPYWFYSPTPMSDDLNIQVKDAAPSLEQIQAQQENYIQQHLYECLDNFKTIQTTSGSTITIQDEKPEITVYYADDSVITKAKFKLSVTKENGKSKTLSSFVTQLPIPFKQYYNTAKSIALTESTDQYLEGLTMELVSRYSGLSSDKLPPLVGFKQGYDQVFWSKTTVKNHLNQLLQTFIPLFNVEGSKNFYEMNLSGLTPSEQTFFKKFTLPFTYVFNPQLSINHIFLPSWNDYIDINPSNGELLTSSTDNSENYGPYFSKPAPDQNYRFFYDVAFPVIVSIHEDNLPGGLDYTFNFALESTVKFNRCWLDYADGKGPLPWDPSWLEFDTGNGFPSDQTGYVEGGDTSYSPEAAKLFADTKQQISGNVTLYTFDEATKEPLTGVYARIGLGSMVSNLIDKTSLDNQGLAELNHKFPIVTNAFIELTKEGYRKKVVPLTTRINESLDLGAYTLEPLAEKNVTVKIYDLNTQTFSDRKFNDTVTLTLTRINSDDADEFTATAVFRQNQTNILLNLLPGTYSISGIYITADGETIPANSKKICDSMVSCAMMKKEDRYIPKEPIEMKPMMWGGVEFTSTYPVTLSKEMIYSNDTIEFRVLRLPHPKSIDDMNMASNLPGYTAKYRSTLLPIQITAGTQQSFNPTINPNI